MKRKTALLFCVFAALLFALAGCFQMGDLEASMADSVVNGTTAGNILNRGYAVVYGVDLYYFYAGGTQYDFGDLVTVPLTSSETRLAMKEAGLYMNIVNDTLYYCLHDGIYRAPLETFERERVLECAATLLQFSGERMYYLENGTIKSATPDGKETDFSPITGADCLNVYNDMLYYINTSDGRVWQAQPDGTHAALFLDQRVSMFCLFAEYIYYIDSTDGCLKKMALGVDSAMPVTIVPYPCSGFNVNQLGVFYTRSVDGENLCCSAKLDGSDEQIITQAGSSARHLICMFNEGSLVIAQEELDPWYKS